MGRMRFDALDAYGQLEAMPFAICVLRVQDTAGDSPSNLELLYCNEAFAWLVGRARDQMVGRPFHSETVSASAKLFDCCMETACTGELRLVVDFLENTGVWIEARTYCPALNLCGCIFRDVTDEVLTEREMEKSRRRLELVVNSTADAIFKLDLATRSIRQSDFCLVNHVQLPEVDNVPMGLVEQGVMLEQDAPRLTNAIARLEAGEPCATCAVQARLDGDAAYKWYEITLATYTEAYTSQCSVIGFLKDVDGFLRREYHLTRAAEHDGLTGLLNRAAAQKKIVHRLEETPGHFAFFMFDLDDFKTVNDTNGHAAGDDVLIGFAAILRDCFRRDDVVFRIGGDEFAAFLNDVYTGEQAARRCRRVYEALAVRKQEISVSIGAAYGDARVSYDAYYQAADRALYIAKKRGKNTFSITACERET